VEIEIEVGDPERRGTEFPSGANGERIQNLGLKRGGRKRKKKRGGINSLSCNCLRSLITIDLKPP